MATAPSHVGTARSPRPEMGEAPGHAAIDLRRLRAYRLGRVRERLSARDYGACVLYDPVNIRYATDSRAKLSEDWDRA